jgi:hypothetical protein
LALAADNDTGLLVEPQEQVEQVLVAELMLENRLLKKP